jgi:hypothetical protein
MPEFKALKDRLLTPRRAAGVVVVYVEASLDSELLSRYLFRDMAGEYIRFEPADDEEGGGGGWEMVVAQVERARADGVFAFGLVDRDALLSSDDEEGMLETDDELLQCEHSLHQHVRVLTRWELENYLLLEPDIVAEAANIHRTKKQQETGADTMLQQLLDIADVLVPVTCSRIMRHRRRSKEFTQCGDPSLSSRALMREAVLNHLGEGASDCGRHTNEYEALEARVEAFADANPQGSVDLWRALNRIVEGKCILKRLPARAVGNEQHLRLLASKLYDLQLIDEELRSHMECFKSALIS